MCSCAGSSLLHRPHARIAAINMLNFHLWQLWAAKEAAIALPRLLVGVARSTFGGSWHLRRTCHTLRCVSLVCQKPPEESCSGYKPHWSGLVKSLQVRCSFEWRSLFPLIFLLFLLSAATKNRRPLSVAINYAAGSWKWKCAQVASPDLGFSLSLSPASTPAPSPSPSPNLCGRFSYF